MLIDWARLHALRNDIGEEDFADIAFLFVAEMGETLDRLRAAPDAAQAEDFHFLKGSAANLGFVAMVAACETAEQACHTGAAPDIAGLAQVFADSLAQATPEVPELGQAA